MESNSALKMLRVRKKKNEKTRKMSPLITVFVVLQVVVRPGPSELCKVLLVVELQEVGPFSAEPQKGGR